MDDNDDLAELGLEAEAGLFLLGLILLTGVLVVCTKAIGAW